MTPDRTSTGCLRGALFLFGALAVVSVIAFGWIAWRLGGIEGFQRQVLIKGAIAGVERQLLSHRPDGIAESEVTATFDALRAATDEQRLDTDALYDAFKRYDAAFRKRKSQPSDGEVRDFLLALEKCARQSSATPSRDL